MSGRSPRQTGAPSLGKMPRVPVNLPQPTVNLDHAIAVGVFGAGPQPAFATAIEPIPEVVAHHAPTPPPGYSRVTWRRQPTVKSNPSCGWNRNRPLTSTSTWRRRPESNRCTGLCRPFVRFPPVADQCADLRFLSRIFPIVSLATGYSHLVWRRSRDLRVTAGLTLARCLSADIVERTVVVEQPRRSSPSATGRQGRGGDHPVRRLLRCERSATEGSLTSILGRRGWSEVSGSCATGRARTQKDTI
jgi:hypothetical protein